MSDESDKLIKECISNIAETTSPKVRSLWCWFGFHKIAGTYLIDGWGRKNDWCSRCKKQWLLK